LLVADANSTDQTANVARIKGAQVTKGGLPGPGRNAGAHEAKTDFLIFLDADVRLFDDEFFYKAVKEFEERDLSCATADLTPMSDSHLDHFGHKVYNRIIRRFAKTKPHAAGSFMMSTRAAHELIDGFDEAILLAEDQDYVERAGKVHAFGVLDSVVVPVSVRRLNRDGRIKSLITYVLAGFHIRVIGPIKHNRFKYEFGYDHMKNKSKK
jgi:glycosyltransferase involved in cell wall biosynthesis